MPKIPDYQGGVSAQAGIPSRQASGNDLGGTGFQDVGQGMLNSGARLAEAQRILNQRKAAAEVTRIDMELAKTEGELTLDLQRQAKEWTPDKGNIADGFKDQARQRLESVFYGKDGTALYESPEALQHWQQRQAKMQEHFTLSSMQVESQVQGQNAINEHVQTVDKLSNNVQNMPEMYGMMREQIEGMIDNPNGRYAAIPAVKRDELKRGAVNALARSAVQGGIRLRPTQTLADLEAGGDGSWHKDDLTDTDYHNLLTSAKTAVHAQAVDKDRAYAEAERQRREMARTISSKLLTKMAAHDADPTNPPLTAQDLIDSDLGKYDDNGLQSLIGILHTRSRESDVAKVVTDPTRFTQIFTDIHRPYGDPKKITDVNVIQNAFGKEKRIDFNAMKQLRQELFESRTGEGEKFSQVKARELGLLKTQITKSNMLMGKIDTDGDLNYSNFIQHVDRQIQQYQAEKKNPYDLFDNTKPDYIGRPEVLRRFQTTMKESMSKFGEKMRAEKNSRPAIKPEEMRKEGESFADWKKRVNP